MSDDEFARLYRKMDVNEDNKVDFEEFCHALEIPTEGERAQYERWFAYSGMLCWVAIREMIFTFNCAVKICSTRDSLHIQVSCAGLQYEMWSAFSDAMRFPVLCVSGALCLIAVCSHLWMQCAWSLSVRISGALYLITVCLCLRKCCIIASLLASQLHCLQVAFDELCHVLRFCLRKKRHTAKDALHLQVFRTRGKRIFLWM